MGLHLYSTVRSVSLGRDKFASRILTGYLSSQDKLVHERSNDLAEDPNSTSISAVAGTKFSYADVDQQEIQAGVAASSDTSNPINSLNPPCDSPPLERTEQQVAPCEGRMSTPQNAGSVEELDQVNSNRKRQACTYCLIMLHFFPHLANLSFWDASRKRTSNTSDSDGCKRCNCKRSKCLKL